MSEIIDGLPKALVYTCVFIHTSRAWEDYENMRLDTEVLDALRSFLDKDAHNEINELSSSIFSTLKTDWSMGVAAASTSVAMLNTDGKAIILNYIENAISGKVKENQGSGRAIRAIIAEAA